jgi:hypothetical protein
MAGIYGLSFNVGSDGEGERWAADGSAFLLTSVANRPTVFSFSDNSSMVSTPSDISGITAGGSATQFASPEVGFSNVNPDIMYELDYNRVASSGLPIVQLNQLTLNRSGAPSTWTMTRQKLFNFVTDSSHCLPSNFFPNWGGQLGVATNDQSFTFALSDHGQDGKRDATHPFGATMVVNYTRGEGCRVVDTYGNASDAGPGQIYGLNASQPSVGPMTIWGDWGPTGPATNGIGAQPDQSGGAPLPDTFYLHAAASTPDSPFSHLAGNATGPLTTSTASCIYSNKPALCEGYFWEVATTNIRPNTNPVATGHEANGNLYDYKGKYYTAFAYGNVSEPLTELLTTPIPVDQHGSYYNGDSQDDQPVFLFSTRVCDNGPGNPATDVPCDPAYTGPLYDEIVAVENQAAHPSYTHCNYGGGTDSTACVYRIAHTFNTGTNWNFSIQNAIGTVSPTGRFALFSSDWNLTLGCTNGQSSGCLDSIAATTGNACTNLQSSACQRGDVFVVQLE